jgi:hypothetical protein
MRQAPEAPVSLTEYALAFDLEDDANRRRAVEASSPRRLWTDKSARRDSQRRGALATLADPEWAGRRRTSKSRKGLVGAAA